MEPWEETWRTNPLDGREVECPAQELPDDDAYRIAEVYMGSEDGTAARFDRARFISAAPDMARALLGQGVAKDGQWHTRECWAAQKGCIVECQGAYHVLTKAGVL